jgi:hypothetical protein
MKIWSGVKTMLLARFGKKLTIMGKMTGVDKRSCIYSLL